MASSSAPTGTTYRALAQDFITSSVFSVAGDEPYVLILDNSTLPLISSAFGLYDVLEHGCALVERLEKPRQRMEDMHAVYFMEPTEANVDLLLADFTTLKGDMESESCCDSIIYAGLTSPTVDRVTYGGVHLVFTRPIAGPLEQRLRAEPLLASRLLSSKAVPYFPRLVEPNAFSIDLPDANLSMCGTWAAGERGPDPVAEGAARLFRACLVAKERPYIRYRADGRYNEIAHRLAQMLACEDPAQFREPRGTLLLLDRTEDVVSPLLHEYTYQCAVYDVLDVENDSFTYESASRSNKTTKRVVPLNASNASWMALRHASITHVIKRVGEMSKECEALEETSRAAQGADAAQALRAFLALQADVSVHTALVKAVQAEFEGRSLYQMAKLEQEIATGVAFVDGKARPVDPATLEAEVLAMLSDSRPTVQDRARLAALYMSAVSSTDDVRRAFEREAGPAATRELKNALVNLTHMGINLRRPGAGAYAAGRAELPADVLALRANASLESIARGATGKRIHTLCRFTPVLRDTLNTFLSGALPTDLYPWAGEPAPDRAGGHHQGASKPAKKSKLRNLKGFAAGAGAGAGAPAEEAPAPQQPRVLIFVAGGVTYSELRSVEEVAEGSGRDIFVGSTSLLTPEEYMRQLGELDKAAAGGPTRRGGGFS